MLLLLLGLVLFLGVHSARMIASDQRAAFIQDKGENTYKAFYSIASLVGLVLIVMGYQQTRLSPAYIWYPPVAMLHIAALLNLAAFVLLAAAYVPGNRIKARLGHPMVLGVKVWAFAHLLSNGRVGDMLLFGAFLAWAVANYISSRRADRVHSVTYSSSNSFATDIATVVAGVVAYLVFALWAHRALMGVAPFGT